MKKILIVVGIVALGFIGYYLTSRGGAGMANVSSPDSTPSNPTPPALPN